MYRRPDWKAVIEILIFGIIMVDVLFTIVAVCNWNPVIEIGTAIDPTTGKPEEIVNWAQTVSNSIEPARWTSLGLIPVAIFDIAMIFE